MEIVNMSASENKSELDEEEKKVIEKVQSLKPDLTAAMAMTQMGLKKYQSILHELSS